MEIDSEPPNKRSKLDYILSLPHIDTVKHIDNDSKFHICPLVLSNIEYSLTHNQGDIIDTNDKILYVVVRIKMINIIDLMRKDKQLFEHNELGRTNCLQGPAGCGKSYLIFTCLHFAKATGWIIAYVPSIKGNSDTMIMQKFIDGILRNNSEEDLNSLCSPSNPNATPTYQILTGIDSIEDKFIELMNRFKGWKANKPIFLAIDQWNAVFELPDGIVKRKWGNLSSLRLTYGVTLTGLSSSFVELPDDFADDEIAISPIFMQPYMEDEMNNLITLKRRIGSLPDQVELPDNDFIEITAKIPRLIYIVETVWLQNKRWDALEYYKRGVKYYQHRITRHLRRASLEDNIEDKRITFKLALDLFINDNASNQGPYWKNSGLFDLNGNPLCKVIAQAFHQCLSNQVNEVLSVLGKRNEFRGALFEMLVINRFERSNETTFIGTRLDQLVSETEIPFGRTFYLNSSRSVIRQERGENYINIYPENTLIICFANHPLIDFVIYTDNFLYFIQVSVISYREHSKQYKKSCDKILKKTKGEDENRKFSSLNNLTIQEYYMLRSPYQKHRDRALLCHNTVDCINESKLIYLYITTDNSQIKQGLAKLEDGWTFKLSGHQLKHVFGGDNIKRLLGDEINDI